MKQSRGQIAYHSGLAAEDGIARHYERRGLSVAGRRWRGQGGEIDLVVRDGAALVFVEVKKARDFAAAALRLSRGQMRRLTDAAQEYLGGEPAGSLTDMRFDVALVDARGRFRIVENAFGGA